MPSLPHPESLFPDKTFELVERVDLLALHIGRLEAEHAERIDLLAAWIGRLEAENAEMRRGGDILAQHVGPLVDEAKSRADRESRVPAPPPAATAPIPITPRRADLTLVRRRIA